MENRFTKESRQLLAELEVALGKFERATGLTVDSINTAPDIMFDGSNAAVVRGRMSISAIKASGNSRVEYVLCNDGVVSTGLYALRKTS